MGCRVLLTVLVLGAFALPGPGQTAEMVMFVRQSCPWCLEWERVIGPVYPKTNLGRRAPLRQVDLDGPKPAALTLLRPVRYTPTFVLIEHGREVGRLEGYPGEDFFWAQAERLLDRLPARP